MDPIDPERLYKLADLAYYSDHSIDYLHKMVQRGQLKKTQARPRSSIRIKGSDWLEYWNQGVKK